MVKRSTWWATAVGTAVGTGGSVLGNRQVRLAHSPGLGAIWITLAATIITQIVVQENIRRKIASR